MEGSFEQTQADADAQNSTVAHKAATAESDGVMRASSTRSGQGQDKRRRKRGEEEKKNWGTTLMFRATSSGPVESPPRAGAGPCFFVRLSPNVRSAMARTTVTRGVLGGIGRR